MDVRDIFKKTTGYDIDDYFNMFVTFVDNHYQNLVDFYSGVDELKDATIDNLNLLKKETKIVGELFDNNMQNFTSNAQFWELLEAFETIQNKVYTIDKTPKWLRSSVIAGGYNRGVATTYIQKQYQSLEDISDLMGSDNSDQEWANMAIDNGISEEDYSADGGKVLSVRLQNNASIEIISVVDSLIGERVYGSDILKKITFENNDLKTLNHRDTINQAFDILLSLQRGDVPQFPEDGIDKRVVTGVNLNSLTYPSIFRQLTQMFRKDDTFKDLSIDSINQKDDNTEIVINVRTRLDETIEGTVTI